MSSTIATVRMHLTKRLYVFGIPALILGIVIGITLLITVIAARLGADISSPEYFSGAGNNAAVLWSIPGFLGYLGVQAVSTTFPFGMSLGATRRAYSLGTSLYFALQSAYLGLLAMVLLPIEIATNYWFIGARVFDVYALGAGNIWTTGATVFTVAFLTLNLGGFFGGLYVKAGPRGPLIMALVLLLVIFALLAIVAPSLVEFFSGTTRGVILGLGIAVAIAALIGEYFSLRTASVR